MLANFVTDFWHAPFTFRESLVLVNLVVGAILVVALYRVALRRGEERAPSNQTEFYPDEVLEGRKLERVLGTALLMVAITAVGLILYALVEPERQAASLEGYDERSIERGEVLFANKSMKSFNSARSLACADCHGVDGGGGTRAFVVQPTSAETAAAQAAGTTARPVQVTWKAPALNTVLLRFPEAQVRDIIIYGRPGTPMAAWGVKGGGPKNEQAIDDLVAYLFSIQKSDEAGRKISSAAVTSLVSDAKKASDAAASDLADAQAALDAAPADGAAAAQVAVANARIIADSTTAYYAELSSASSGNLLFLTNCARCHTKGWSFFDASDPWIAGQPEGKQLQPQGSGAYGPNLTGGDTLRQFPEEASHIDFVSKGSEFQKSYGTRGIGSGRMPGFATVLTADQIKAIVEYERSL